MSPAAASFGKPFSSSPIPADPVGGAEQNRRRLPLKGSELYHVFSFLEPKDLGRLERVNTVFEDAVGYQWRSRCRELLSLPIGADLNPFLPEDLSVKTSVLLLSNNVFDERVYDRHIGDVEPALLASQIKSIFLKNCNKPDPCDPTKKIGTEYVLMYIPEYITINRNGVSLDKADDPNNAEAPRLIQTAANSEGVQSENTTLKVAVTINNLRELFQEPKIGHPSTYSYIGDQIANQHGNKRVPAQWVCMRKDVIGRKLTFNQQLELAREKEVVPTELLPRILFNFLISVRAANVNTYQDGRNPWTIVRTQTLTNDSNGNSRSSGCGGGGPSGLRVCNDFIDIGNDNVGVAVALP
ncbi:MAG TPA: hypothetical protein VLE96_07330 [Chlamydiales bacterium]|nr:hypothetical protein [Chlamydiales bacterium]